ncbi:hypothetical protein BH10CHL1_BH10CHL1_13980 [soil metagenome]
MDDMPTIFRQDGLAFIIYLNDLIPSYVHVFKAEAELIVNLGNEVDAAVRARKCSDESQG